MMEEHQRLGCPLHRKKIIEPRVALEAITRYFEGGQVGPCPGTMGTPVGDEEDEAAQTVSHFTCSNNFEDEEWYLLAHGASSE